MCVYFETVRKVNPEPVCVARDHRQPCSTYMSYQLATLLQDFQSIQFMYKSQTDLPLNPLIRPLLKKKARKYKENTLHKDSLLGV